MSSQKEKLLASAQKYIQKGQFDRALRDYEQIVTADPKDVKHRQKLAELLVRCNRKDDAIREYETIAKYYDENGFYLKAIAVYKQVQRLDPSNIEISLALAALNEKQGMIGNALSEYKTVYDYHKNSGRLDEAARILEKMQAVDPDNVDIRLTLAETLFAGGAADKSYQEFNRAALAFRSRGDMVAFERVNKRIQDLFPDRVDSGVDLLEEQLRNGAVGDVLPRLEQLYHDNPGNDRVRGLLIEAYRMSGDHGARKELLARILQANPDDMEAIKGLIDATVAGGELEESIGLINHYLPRLHEAGAYGEVEHYYTALLNLDPYDVRLLEGLKKQYELTGESSKLADIQVSLNIILQKAEGGMEAPASPSDAGIPGATANHTAPGPVEFSWGAELDLSGLAGITADDARESIRGEADIAGDVSSGGGEEHAEQEQEGLLELDISFELPEGDDLFIASKVSTEDEASPVVPEPAGEAVSQEGPIPGENLFPEEELTLLEPGETEVREEDGGAEDSGGLEFLEEITLDFVEFDNGVETTGRAVPPAEETASLPPEEPLADIAPHLDETAFLPEESPETESPAEPPFFRMPERSDFDDSAGKYTFDGMFSRFKESLDRQLDSGDTETHYNLGIAYMEMGLYDEAIKEFRIAGKDPARKLDCLTLQGVCCRDKGDFDEAEKIITSGLSMEGLDTDRTLSLRYELALLQEAAGRKDEALHTYREIFVVNPGFRDTMKKIARLSGKEIAFDLSGLDEVDIELK